MYQLVEQLHKKNFIRQGKKLKIKHSTVQNTYELDGRKHTDIFDKIIGLQYSLSVFMSGR